jgi:integrase/recombinase XerD
VKQNLAALRMLFDWLVTGHIIEANPAHAVRGPKHIVRKGKTPYLASDEAHELLDGIETTTLVGLRDRALIATMTYTFARVSAAIGMKVRDYYVLGRRSRVRLHEKGGKEHEVPCHHNLEKYLDDYIAAAGIAEDPDGPLFRTAPGKPGMPLTRKPMSRLDSFRMIQRRAKAAGIPTLRLGNHSLRATGITAFRPTMEPWKAHKTLPPMRRRARPNFTITARMTFRSMTWRRFQSDTSRVHRSELTTARLNSASYAHYE